MMKYENIDIPEAMRRIVASNTEYYQTDVAYDMDKVLHGEDRDYLFLSRVSGAWCFPEPSVYIKDAQPNTTWLFFEQCRSERVLAYALHVKQRNGRTVLGDLYELDYDKSVADIKQHGTPLANVELRHTDGRTLIVPVENLNGHWPEYEGYSIAKYLPRDGGALDAHLHALRSERQRLSPAPLDRLMDKLNADALKRCGCTDERFYRICLSDADMLLRGKHIPVSRIDAGCAKPLDRMTLYESGDKGIACGIYKTDRPSYDLWHRKQLKAFLAGKAAKEKEAER
mgnify:CR=1 FL=1